MTRLYLTEKKALEFHDPGGAFLKGYGANTLQQPRNAFVDIKGKVVATFDQLSLPEERVLVIIEQSARDGLFQHLSKYLPISKVNIEEKNYSIYFDLEGSRAPQKEEWTIPQKKGQLLITSKAYPVSVSEEEFTLFRLHHHIPIQGKDYGDEMLLNIDPAEFASFTKGCYLGQEVLSRVHFKSKPPRKLVVSSFEECTEEEQSQMTSMSIDRQTGKKIGFLFVNNK